MSQKSSAAFRVTDDSDKSEGVAGKVWSTRKALIYNNLPNMNAKATKAQRKAYAKTTNSDVAMVDKYIADERPMPRSIAAIPVEVRGEPWGVVVLDSRHENGVTQDSVVNYQLTVALIGQLLEKA